MKTRAKYITVGATLGVLMTTVSTLLIPKLSYVNFDWYWLVVLINLSVFLLMGVSMALYRYEKRMGRSGDTPFGD